MNKSELLSLLELISNDKEIKNDFLDILINILDLKKNEFHPLVFINGTPSIGKNVYIGYLSEVNAKNSKVIIEDNCDIASFVSINVADSHKYAIGLSKSIERGDIHIEKNVFIGSHSFIGKNVHIGHHSVVGAGTVLINSGYIPPNSLIIGNPAKIIPNHYNNK